MSLTTKLTLAFLLVGLSSTLLLGFLVRWQTNRQFDRFIDDVNRVEQLRLQEVLESYYAEERSWEGIDRLVGRRLAPNSPPSRLFGEQIILLDTDGRVLTSRPRRFESGAAVEPTIQQRSVPLTVDDQVVGYLFLEGATSPPAVGGQPASGGARAPEQTYLTGVRRALVLSVIGAIALAVVLGGALARTIARPVRTLTEAANTLASGHLGLQVPVHSDDEMGELGHAFNRMSSDLADARTLRQQMTADIAHELRTPLTTLLGYTEALHDGKLESSQQIVSTLHEETLHLQRLVEDLRLLSLADADELPLHRQAVPVAQLFERVARRHRPEAEARQVRLRVEEPQTPLTLWVDEERIVQVLSNLVSNALRHTPADGRITLSATRRGEMIELRVADSGQGIAAEQLPHLFERFYRVDSSRRSDGAQSGLGLSIVESLVEAHGGTVSAHSDGPGLGTTITVRLPTDPSVA